MKSEFQQLQRYVHDALGIDVSPAPWRAADTLPHFLRERYAFAQAILLGMPYLLVLDTSRAEETPAALRKHLEWLRTKYPGEAIYVRAQVSAYNRKRLIEHKVAFIVPGNQMYLPMLAIDLREHFRRARVETREFSPATQAVVIHALLHNATEGLTPLATAQRLGYSPMTMTRAFDELEAANLGVTTVRGRARHLHFPGSRQEIWAKSQSFLHSPTNKRLFIRQGAPLRGVRAGLTALAYYSMLSPPTFTTVAVSREQWNEFHHRHEAIVAPEGDPEGQEIQVWSYAPALFAKDDTVDPLSLYLALKDDADDRIQASLDEMMRNLKW